MLVAWLDLLSSGYAMVSLLAQMSLDDELVPPWLDEQMVAWLVQP
jgi:hypothetical protein